MANTATNVSVGKPQVGGAVFFAPAGTALPTDATTPLASDFLSAGYISEDGVTNAIETESKEIKAWGGDVVLNPQTSRSEKYGMTFIEGNAVTYGVVFGKDNVKVEVSGAISIKHNGAEREERVMVVETLHGELVKRQVIPRAKLLEVGEIVYKDDDAVGYEATFSALIDNEGNTAYEYIAKVAAQ